MYHAGVNSERGDRKTIKQLAEDSRRGQAEQSNFERATKSKSPDHGYAAFHPAIKEVKNIPGKRKETLNKKRVK